MNKMSPNNSNLLIDHLDETLQGGRLTEAEELILRDAEMAAEWDLLRFTAANIYDAGLHSQVAAIKTQDNLQQTAQSRNSGGIVRTMNQKIMRVAAVLVFVIFSAAIYKYVSVNDTSMYDKYYSAYELSTSRGTSLDDELDNAYRNKNWQSVVSITNGISAKNSKHLFLQGIANLELKRYSDAVKSFTAVVENNRVSADDYFKDEAEYYLALSYLASGQSNKAVSIFQGIKQNKQHSYYAAVSKMGVDFTILKAKAAK